MVAKLLGALVVVGGLFAVGCAAEEPKPRKQADSSEKDKDKDKDSSDDDSVSGEDDTSSTSSQQTAPTADQTTPPATDPTNPTNPTDPTKPGPPTPDQIPTGPADATKKGGCTSNIDTSYKSVSNLAWEIRGEFITFTSLTVTVTNKDGRNQNDVSVYVRVPGGDEKKVFNSGDILVNGKLVTVPLPKTFLGKVDGIVRLETVYDKSLIDPKSSCTVQL